jgi:hypothetical protein
MAANGQLLAWLTCDGVHIDPMSGKHTLLGVFSNLRGVRFPIVHPRMFWFLSVTSVAAGKHELSIHISLPLGDRKTLLRRPFESPGPVHRLNLINEIKNLRFDQPGDYAIEVEIDNETLLVTTLNVSQHQQ